jgi:hypothetical protein
VPGQQPSAHVRRLSDEVSDNRHGQRRTSADIHGRSAAGQARCDAGKPCRNLASGRRGHPCDPLKLGRRPAWRVRWSPYQMQTESMPVGHQIQILTRHGWLKHDEVRIGGETVGYNPETGRSQWTRITAVKHYGIAPMVQYGNKYWSAECTPDHRWLTERIVRRWITDDPQTDLACPECGATSSRRGPGGQYGSPFRSWRAVQIHRGASIVRRAHATERLLPRYLPVSRSGSYRR